MDKFFIRFNLQSSQGTFGESFPYDAIMEAQKQEVDEFINECENMLQKRAEELASKMDLSRLYSKKVMFLGDSQTADRLSYRAIVSKAAKLTAYNAAISGAVSADMFRCFRDHLSTFTPDVVSVLLGSNDSLVIADEKNLISKEEFRLNIEKIISISKSSGADVIISTLPPVIEERIRHPYKRNYNKDVDKYCDVIREVAEKENIILNDFSAKAKNLPTEEIIETDGVHLTPYGQYCMAETWLETYLKKGVFTQN